MNRPLRERQVAYAHLIATRGAALAGDEEVQIYASVEQSSFVPLVAEACYALGARYVDVLYVDSDVDATLSRHGDEEARMWSPPWLIERLEWLADQSGVSITLRGGPAADLGAQVRQQELQRRYLQLLNEGRFRRTTVPVPTAGWAALRYGQPDLDRLWEEVLIACRADASVAEWDERMDALERRALALTAETFDAVRFRGPGTDLTVGLIPEAHWLSIQSRTATGQRYAENLPTEEVMTAPHRLRVSGTVVATRPTIVYGHVVENLELRFDAGRVTDVAATRGGNVLSNLFASDERARFLGEVALVDGNSPAAQLDGVFYNLLIDENAVSHIALGAAYAATMPDVREQTAAYRRAVGLNDASVHVDIPIGGEAVDVDGIRNDEVVPILRRSEWLM